MAGSSWGLLPSVLIVDILSYLSLKDRLRAASICKRWRSCLFHPSLWHRLSLDLHQNGREKTKFLVDVCGRFVRDFILKFDSRRPEEVRECFRTLQILSGNKNLRVLQLEPSSCHIEWPDNLTSQRFVKKLQDIIETCRKLRHFSVGCSEELMTHGGSLLHLLSSYHGNSLEGLHLASVKEDPENYGIVDMDVSQLCMFTHLKHLSIDYDFLDNQSLEILAMNHDTDLHSLCIHVTGMEPGKKITNATWRHVVSKNKHLKVTINLLHSYSGVDNLLDILQSNMPLAHFRQFFCSNLNLAAIGLMAEHYSSSLKTIHIVDGFVNKFPLIYSSTTDEDPFVMLAWKCINLESITIIGYEVSDYDVIAMARLRGSDLKELVIPDSCIQWQDPDTESGDFLGDLGPEFANMVSSSLKRRWRPILDTELPDAVFVEWADTETMFHNILIQDQTFQPVARISRQT